LSEKGFDPSSFAGKTSIVSNSCFSLRGPFYRLFYSMEQQPLFPNRPQPESEWGSTSACGQELATPVPKAKTKYVIMLRDSRVNVTEQSI